MAICTAVNPKSKKKTPKICSGSQKQKCSGHFYVRGSKAPETAQNDDFWAVSGIRYLFILFFIILFFRLFQGSRPPVSVSAVLVL